MGAVCQATSAVHDTALRSVWTPGSPERARVIAPSLKSATAVCKPPSLPAVASLLLVTRVVLPAAVPSSRMLPPMSVRYISSTPSPSKSPTAV